MGGDVPQDSWLLYMLITAYVGLPHTERSPPGSSPEELNSVESVFIFCCLVNPKEGVGEKKKSFSQCTERANESPRHSLAS